MRRRVVNDDDDDGGHRDHWAVAMATDNDPSTAPFPSFDAAGPGRGSRHPMMQLRAMQQVYEQLVARHFLLTQLQQAAQEWTGDTPPSLEDLMLLRAVQLSMNDQAGKPSGPPPASEGAIDALVRHNGLSHPQLAALVRKDMSSCAVCLDAFVVGADVNYLPCSHPFCRECIVPWLKQHRTCPVCRAEVKGGSDDDRSTAPSSSAAAAQPPARGRVPSVEAPDASPPTQNVGGRERPPRNVTGVTEPHRVREERVILAETAPGQFVLITVRDSASVGESVRPARTTTTQGADGAAPRRGLPSSSSSRVEVIASDDDAEGEEVEAAAAAAVNSRRVPSPAATTRTATRLLPGRRASGATGHLRQTVAENRPSPQPPVSPAAPSTRATAARPSVASGSASSVPTLPPAAPANRSSSQAAPTATTRNGAAMSRR